MCSPAVNDVLELLAAAHPQAAQLVTLRFFGYFSMTEEGIRGDGHVRGLRHHLWVYAGAVGLREKTPGLVQSALVRHSCA